MMLTVLLRVALLNTSRGEIQGPDSRTHNLILQRLLSNAAYYP
jgi:hypothetical protein